MKMAEEELVGKLTKGLRGLAQKIECSKDRRIFIEVARESLIDVVKHLKEEYDGYHLTTITATDAGEQIELLYHIVAADKLCTLRTKLPKSDPSVDTITGVIPGAVLYEREIHDIMGVKVKGHPDMRILLLPDSWGNKGFPLRKDWVDPRKVKQGGDA